MQWYTVCRLGKAVYVNSCSVYAGTRCHLNRWSQPERGRESRGEEHTVTVRPGPFNPTTFCYTDPHHRTPALHLRHFQTLLVRQSGRFRKDVKKGNYFPWHLSPNFRLGVKTDPPLLCPRRNFFLLLLLLPSTTQGVLMHDRFGEVTV